jgi:Ribosomal silencing factor during starvation
VVAFDVGLLVNWSRPSSRASLRLKARSFGPRIQGGPRGDDLLLGVENTGDGQWSLLDYGELVIHVFHHPIREFYDLEGLWSQVPRVPIDVPADSQLQYSDAYGM